MKRIPVSILGATGMVGQRFIQLLDQHPLFNVEALAASKRSSGKTYEEACRWLLPEPMPEAVREMEVLPVDAEFDSSILFSALPGSAAREVESMLAGKGYKVLSNASTHRMDPDVPLLIPEINPGHTGLVKTQACAAKGGYLVTSANCCTTILVLSLKPLHDAFRIQKISLVTLQAISGAGYPGVASLDILGNIVPFISGEEDKLETETNKLLGTLKTDGILPAGITISAQCNRVPVVNGHTVSVSLSFEQRPSRDEFIQALQDFQPPDTVRDLPSTPTHPVLVMDQEDRPQPALDIDSGNGMSVSVGRVRECSILDYRFVVLGHNTLRGAAGGAIHNAELLHAQGLLD